MRILNLGAGVQSTTVFLMAHEGFIDPIEYAIFADTQDEPKAVYAHLEWLKTVPSPVPIILEGTAGNLGDCLIQGKPNKHRFASIPAFTARDHNARHELTGCEQGRVPRQCTKEHKIEVVERIIRREVMGLKPRQRMPKGTMLDQLFGISWDERNRAIRIRKRVKETGWANPLFPLIDMRMTREDCKQWLKSRVPHETPRSSCVYCPNKDPFEWQQLKRSPEDWARAIEVDNALRTDALANRAMEQSLYIHRKCIPLQMVDVDKEAEKYAAKIATPLFNRFLCDEGMCGL